MRKNLKRFLAASLFAFSLNFAAPSVHAMPPILPYEEVTEGMQGTAYTVLDTSGEIRTFPIEIIGRMESGKGSQRMIMARTSGDFIEHVGGVLQGMSGSPIYVDGRLIGALAAGLKDLSPYTFFITPIEDMTPLWDMPDTKNQTRIQTVNIVEAVEARRKAEEKEKLRAREKAVGKMSRAEREAEWRDMIDALTGKKADDTKGTEETSEGTNEAPEENTPAQSETAEQGKTEEKAYFFTRGFNAAGLRYLEKNLPAGTTFIPLGTTGDSGKIHTRYDATLEGGQPIGVAVVYGDFSIGATGTVTAVDGKKVVAFGHSFMHKGNVNYFMTDADVIGTIAGQSNGVKIANIGSVIGRISQDRETGVAGTLGTFPTAVPVRIHVKDDALGTEETFGAQIAYDEDFLPVLSSSIAYAAMSKVSDALGSSTARIHFTIRTNAYENGMFERRNMYYNTADVGQIAVTELLQALGTIVTNAEKESDIVDVDVDVELTGDRQTALLVSATPDKTTVKPGETVTFQTKIRPYRKPEETLSIPYKVPKDQVPGTLNLDIRGGGFVPVSPLALLAQAGLEVPDDEERFKTTEEKLRDLAETGQNNEVIIAPGAAPAPASEKELKKRIKEAAKASARAAKKEQTQGGVKLLADEKKREKKERFFAPYVIENVIHASLKVEE
ncbi:SpoIVB peptidase S55 domain-containing protein [Selenomonas artemidis]|uniref:SpoIVB peptidase S55 domain-containing protein n=1 Tax=Selenomonas artemidis TaxID=671224 RepID=UPI0028EF083F|nr:SpoIVB peptidase S55 domain-containing protein [Selenomonas artemidis]